MAFPRGLAAKTLISFLLDKWYGDLMLASHVDSIHKSDGHTGFQWYYTLSDQVLMDCEVYRHY